MNKIGCTKVLLTLLAAVTLLPTAASADGRFYGGDRGPVHVDHHIFRGADARFYGGYRDYGYRGNPGYVVVGRDYPRYYGPADYGPAYYGPGPGTYVDVNAPAYGNCGPRPWGGDLQYEKNGERNAAIATGTLGVIGLATHNTPLAVLGIAGAIISGSQYEQDRHLQSQEQNGNGDQRFYSDDAPNGNDYGH